MMVKQMMNRYLWDFGEYTDQDLLAIRYHLNQLENLLGQPFDKMDNELSSEIKERGLEDESFRRMVVMPIHAYRGKDTALEIYMDEEGFTYKKDKMWVIVEINEDGVKEEMTDYGYRTKEKAIEGTEAYDCPVITPSE